jgi:hypothetical protein
MAYILQARRFGRNITLVPSPSSLYPTGEEVWLRLKNKTALITVGAFDRVHWVNQQTWRE